MTASTKRKPCEACLLPESRPLSAAGGQKGVAARGRRKRPALRPAALVLALLLAAGGAGASSSLPGGGLPALAAPLPEGGAPAAGEGGTGRGLLPDPAERAACDRVERSIRALLAPLYGEGHVVVMASMGSPVLEGRRRPVAVAVVVDRAAMPNLPESVEGLRAEQDRLALLAAHASGLSSRRGDSVVVSFQSFRREGVGSLPRGLWLALAGAAVALAGCALALSWHHGRPGRPAGPQPAGNGEGSGAPASDAIPSKAPAAARSAGDGRRKNDTAVAPVPDSGGEEILPAGSGRPSADGALHRLADAAWQERPQVRAVLLSLLAPRDAAALLAAWAAMPGAGEGELASILERMAGSRPMEAAVARAVCRQFGQAGKVAFEERQRLGEPAVADVLGELASGSLRERLLAQLVSTMPCLGTLVGARAQTSSGRSSSGSQEN